ncbi:MAG: RNA-binding S4 domain-containing protein, partial [Lactobacillus iners]|nr:RNA-binding S4 domain-containing protein [Lactobacillus iners]
SSGGQAKWYLNENPVMLNGVLENRRGKKIHPGDQIVINKNLYNFIMG